MLSPLKHVSPFDVNMALDAGFNSVVPYTSVELAEVRGLTQDAIFSRGPKGAKRTGLFIGGKDAAAALDMLEAARKAMFPPFQISAFADPAGSFTTAAAMVAKVEKALKTQTGGGLDGRTVAVFGATGVVGFAASVIAAAEGAKVNMMGYDGPTRVKALAARAKERFGVDLASSDGSSDALKVGAIKSVDVVLCAGRAGVQILSSAQLSRASDLKAAADVNAVPPAGIEGVGAQDDGVALKAGIGIGALAIGAVKYKVQSGLFRKMIETEKPLFLDFRDAFTLARELVG
jgi:methylene-tetrahydromethanopterin dehydrogenase